MEVFVESYFDQLIGPLLDPRKRVFFGYLGAAVLIAFAVRHLAIRSGKPDPGKAMWSPRVWWSQSARLDYLIVTINQAVSMGLAGRLLTKLAVGTALFEAMHLWFDGRPMIGAAAPAWLIASSFTLALFLLDDFAKYAVHRALHAVPLLWSFHKVHHTAETLTPFTVYRTHPVEGVIFAFRASVVQGVAIAGFVFFFGDRAELLTVLGANVILFAFNATGSNLRHSHVWISYGKTIERYLISPAQHQIHHSIAGRHRDRNFGAVLAVWDRIFGSLELAGTWQRLTFGVRQETAAAHDLKSAYLTPFHEALSCLRRLVQLSLEKMFNRSRLKSLSRINLFVGALVFSAIVAQPGAANSGELNIYSHRQPFLIEPFIKAYREKIGTDINIVYASKGLAQRLQAEGARSPADVILTVDIARLNVYADKKLLAQIDSKTLHENIPPHLRDPDNRWFAFSKRARIVVVSKQAADARKIKTYEDLADPKWKGRICARPGSHVYNRALIASLINASGEKGAEQWAQGVHENLARRPQGNDRAQVKAIYEGVCDIAIINNYYFGKLKQSDKPAHRKWAEAVTLIFPNQSDRGTHVNISGGGVAKHSKNKEEAVRFLEFLTSKAAQDLYGSVNYEYPVNPKVPVSAELSSWGTFQEDKMPIARIAELAPKAQRIIDRVGW